LNEDSAHLRSGYHPRGRSRLIDLYSCIVSLAGLLLLVGCCRLAQERSAAGIEKRKQAANHSTTPASPSSSCAGNPTAPGRSPA